MFDFRPKSALPAQKALELVKVQLTHARESNDDAMKAVWCDYADTVLGNMRNLVKRPSPSRKNEDSQTLQLQQDIADAYLEHANLVADLQLVEKAEASRRRANKWGGSRASKLDTAGTVSKTTGAPDFASVPKSVFPEDTSPLALPWTFPKPDGRVESTPQLVSCLSLLKQKSEDLPEDALDPVARKWLKETAPNLDEKARLETMATDIIRAFTRDEIKDKKAIAEVICLAPVLGEDDFRFLLSLFLKNMDGSRILDKGALWGLARLLQGASPGHLHAQDLIEVLTPMSSRLQETHEQSPDHIFELTMAVSSVLDAMADTKVTGLKREELHGPLLAFLGGLQGSNDPYLKYYASYAFQALLCVPDDESPWQATVRRTTAVVKGISGLVSAVKGLDLNGFISGLQDIQKGFEGVQQIFALGQTAYEGISAVVESGQDLTDSLKDALTFNRKRAWYSALRGADTLIDGGELAKLRTLICEAPCRRELYFQWGVCQRLGILAANSLWGIETRQGAVRFLEEIYRGDNTWGQHLPVKGYILDILRQLNKMENDLQVASLLEVLATDGDATKQDTYRASATTTPTQPLVKSGLPEIASPSLLDRVLKRTDVEADLRRIARQRFIERGGTVYVPPLAKAHLHAVDEEAYPLTPKVDEFLKGDQTVLLLLGDSGVGKTTFNRELDLKLWNTYKPRTGRIPLLISLPAIERPDKDLIAKHLRLCEFNESQIRELKDREFVVICDGYDESQQTQNLYESNGWNQDGGWKVQMVVSCRSERVGQDYLDLFQPSLANPSDPSLLVQAVLIPFSMGQVKEYIAQYVLIKRPLWEASDYEGILDQIPSLQDLVKNPFLLTLSLEVLPRLTSPGQKLAANKITRVLLYDEFVAQWLERNKKRLAAQDLSDKEKAAFESLSDDGFTLQGLVYLKDLSAAIYREQNGTPVVDYSKARDQQTWKEQFFGRKDDEIRLLQKAMPLTRNGSRFGFIHRSILEYGVSRAIYEPQKRTGIKLQEIESDTKRHKRTGSVLSFESAWMVEAEAAETPKKGPDPDSLLVKRNFVKDSSVIQFLVERSQAEPAFKDQLLAFIEESKNDSSKKWRTAATNAITILIKSGMHFSGQDLQNIQVPGADLSNGVFDSTQLQGADLRKTNLQGAWLRQADLTNTRMHLAKFGELPTLKDEDLYGPFTLSRDGKTLAASTDYEKILLYDTSTWTAPVSLELEPEDGEDNRSDHLLFSPDGSILAAVGSALVRLWNVATKNFIILEGHHFKVTGLDFSPDGNYLVTAGHDKTLRLWKVETGETVQIFYHPNQPGGVEPSSFEDPEEELDYRISYNAVSDVRFSHDGNIIASSHDDGSAVLWDPATGDCVHLLKGYSEYVNGVVFSPDDSQIATYGVEKTIKIWDVHTGDCLWTLEGHEGAILDLAYSPTTQHIASVAADNTIRLWDSTTGIAGAILRGHTENINSIVYSPTGRQILTASDDKTVRLWDAQNGTLGTIYSGHTDAVSRAAFTTDGLQIVSSSNDTTIRLWDAKASAISSDQGSFGHKSMVCRTLYLPDGQHIASQCSDLVRIWDKETGKLRQIMQAPGYSIADVASLPNGTQIATSGRDRTTRLWDLQTGECTFVMPGYDQHENQDDDDDNDINSELGNYFTGLVVSPNGNWIATAGIYGVALIWNRLTGELAHQLEGHSQAATLFAFSPHKEKDLLLATGSRDTTVRLWNVHTGQCMHVLEGHGEGIAKIAFLQQGTRIATASEDCTLRLWDTNTGSCLWDVDTGCVDIIQFSHNATLLAMNREDTETYGTLLIWDTLKGEQLWSLQDDTQGYVSASFSPDGSLLVSSCKDQVVRLWDLATGQQLTTVENIRGAVSSYQWSTEAGSVTSEQPSGRILWSLTIGATDGDLSVWNLLEKTGHDQGRLSESSIEKSIKDLGVTLDDDTDHGSGNTSDNGNGNGNGNGSKNKQYKFELKWTTAYGKFNAEAAIIDEVKGLSRTNIRLLEQNGAKGVPVTLNLRQAANKLMDSRKPKRLLSLLESHKAALSKQDGQSETTTANVIAL